MTLIISQETEQQVQTSNVVEQHLWEDSQRSLPLAHLALEYLAEQALRNGISASVRPVDLEHLPGYNFEQYCLQIKALRFSDALWNEAQKRYQLILGTQLCHLVGAFTLTPAGRKAYQQFIAANHQVLCQIKGMTDC